MEKIIFIKYSSIKCGSLKMFPWYIGNEIINLVRDKLEKKWKQHLIFIDKMIDAVQLKKKIN